MFVLNILISATAISVASWLSGRFPVIAGFVVALPLSTMLVLPLSRLQHGPGVDTPELATSILIAVPVTLVFLVPFAVMDRVGLSFPGAYALACAWLVVGYFLHRYVVGLL